MGAVGVAVLNSPSQWGMKETIIRHKLVSGSSSREVCAQGAVKHLVDLPVVFWGRRQLHQPKRG